ncbi:MAG: type I-E CRISPR-associated endonuclease Cas1 [Coriobacteriia bacterium]|nr:type I-E CRISPR-associated endonuclease Cas1 [Coriobacteriia bacterium]MBS5478409.1 type I-E CRISPR-associated endonuclease Cas1 [Coriobacteriia bacterium]
MSAEMSGGGTGGPRKKPLGSPPPEVTDLARVQDRLTFAYFERCTVSRSDNAITIVDDEGTVYLPAASLNVLMLGPGTTVTHRAMTTIGENGATVIWVGERGVRMYAFGKPLTHSSALLQRQAALVSNARSRLAVARRMYGMRFEGEDVSKLTMQQLRGREGARVRKVYRARSHETGVPWDKRVFDPNDYDAGSEINKALSAAHTCLYGIVHAAIVALGCSPGLGFVHTGHEKSFVYDIADLYKADVSIPVAFRAAATKPDDIGSVVRHAMRDEFYNLAILDRIVSDVKDLLLGEVVQEPDTMGDLVTLWDDKRGEVPAGKSYAEDWDLGAVEET